MKKENIKIFIFSLMLILVILLHNAFSIFLETIFGTIDLVFLAAIVFAMIGAVIFSMVRIIVDKKYMHFILILAVGIGAYMFILQPLGSFGVNLEYNMNSADRHKIVQMFVDGKIKYNGYDQYVKLPDGYTKLSKFHGLMMVDNRDNHLRIGFVADNSYLNRHHVVIYVADDGVLKDNDFGEELSDIKKIDGHWYEATAEVMM